MSVAILALDTSLDRTDRDVYLQGAYFVKYTYIPRNRESYGEVTATSTPK